MQTSGGSGPGPAPPDAAVAVGPTAVLTADNAEVRLQDRDGNPIAKSSLRDLFRPAHLSPAELQTDPRAVYDPDSGRFLVMATVYPAVNCVRSVCPTGTPLAVSTSSTPPDLSGQSWHAWLLPGWAPGTAPAGAYLDFPDFSVGRDAIVRYGDFFDATIDPDDQTVWVLGEYTRSATTDGMWLAHIT